MDTNIQLKINHMHKFSILILIANTKYYYFEKIKIIPMKHNVTAHINSLSVIIQFIIL